METHEQLQIISKAWGKQRGYCFFPTISGSAKDKKERIQSYREGPAFLWPKDKLRIIKYLDSHRDDDVYWCPSLFEYDRRQAEVAMDEHALWADLDEIDPREIEDVYKPTIAWETSPGRFQALWLITGGDIQNASWPGYENQRLTYYLGADNSGWDTTQLLRLPGGRNHKPDRRSDNGGEPWEGKLLWKTGPRYLPDHFEDLPEVSQITQTANLILETELDRIDRHELWAKTKLKLKPHIREFMQAREVSGDRSEVLWQIERELADAGLSVTEIVALVRPLVWNKYRDRADELKRLSIEAARAIDERPDDAIGHEVEYQKRPEVLQGIGEYLAALTPPNWLIQDLWAQGSCGFIAGQPKSYKSWFALDMALALSTGDKFLGHFRVVKPGPVLYIQEEDSGPMLKKRYTTIMESAAGMYTTSGLNEDGTLEMVLKEPRDANPDVDVLIRQNFIVSDGAWMEWLDEKLSQREYVAVMIDPLMMVLGDVEENRAAAMTEKVFKPLKQMSEKYGVAIIVVHHMKKGDGNGARGGQMMLGSVANHAWTEDSLYLTHLTKASGRGNIHVEVESKHAQGGYFNVDQLRNRKWTPVVIEESLGDDEPHDDAQVIAAPRRAKKAIEAPKIVRHMLQQGAAGYTSNDLAKILGTSLSGVYRQLKRAEAKGFIRKQGTQWMLTEKV